MSPQTSHSICPLKISAPHRPYWPASILTCSGLWTWSTPSGRDFDTKDFDSVAVFEVFVTKALDSAVLEVVAPGGEPAGSFGPAFAGETFGTGSKNIAADEAAGTGLGSLVKAAFF